MPTHDTLTPFADDFDQIRVTLSIECDWSIRFDVRGRPLITRHSSQECPVQWSMCNNLFFENRIYSCFAYLRQLKPPFCCEPPVQTWWYSRIEDMPSSVFRWNYLFVTELKSKEERDLDVRRQRLEPRRPLGKLVCLSHWFETLLSFTAAVQTENSKTANLGSCGESLILSTSTWQDSIDYEVELLRPSLITEPNQNCSQTWCRALQKTFFS